MTDHAGFKHGGVTFPLAASTAQKLLRDADPCVFYMLEYYAQVIRTHIGARLLAEVSGMDLLTAVVADTIPMNPEPYLLEKQTKLPILGVHRKSTTFEYMGTRKLAVNTMEVVYVLPPMQAAEAERILPILHAIAAVIDNRTEQGFDPAYTPTTPAGSAGEKVWAADRAGLARVEVTAQEFGGFAASPELFFPAVVLTVVAKERSEGLVTELEAFAGPTVALDHVSPDDTTVDDLVGTALLTPPVLVSVDTPTGTKAGGTPITLTCTDLVVGRRYRAIFGGCDASSVLCISATQITCLTPQHAAYPTLAVDVYLIDQDGQLSNTLTTAFTFTTP